MIKKYFPNKSTVGSPKIQFVILKGQNRLIFGSILATCALLLASTLLLAIAYKYLPPQIPLYYSRPWGEAMLAKTQIIWMLPGIIFSLLIFDWFISTKLAKTEIYLAKVLILILLISTVLTTWTLVKIILLIR